VTRFGVTQQELGLRAVEKYAPAYFFERKANFRKSFRSSQSLAGVAGLLTLPN